MAVTRMSQRVVAFLKQSFGCLIAFAFFFLPFQLAQPIGKPVRAKNRSFLQTSGSRQPNHRLHSTSAERERQTDFRDAEWILLNDVRLCMRPMRPRDKAFHLNRRVGQRLLKDPSLDAATECRPPRSQHTPFINRAGFASVWATKQRLLRNLLGRVSTVWMRLCNSEWVVKLPKVCIS